MLMVIRGINAVGARTRSIVGGVGLGMVFLVKTLASLFSAVPPFQEIVKQILFVGVRSLPVLLVSSLFTGMVVALQFYDTLVRFGSVDLLGSAVALSLIRELGPVMTALMVIARVSSATCAEIGIMRNEQQFDALDCMAIDSYRYVMLPRLLASIVAVPILTAVFDMVGIAGGYLVGVIIHGESEGAYIQGIFDTVNLHDVMMGQVKSLVFGLVVMWVPLVYGYYLHLDREQAGAAGVSRATTHAVVLSAILMLISDYVISSLLL
ncbi:MAG: ABC transporter permease [Pseudomonadota bacterium]|uniref:MlaE family ABC transporter permease n=1 Tax=Gallaecimonas pentaromativorans TaxID=584787 RepID=UPI000AA7AA85|nr:ABC transporter permease [Gallaecimonas pentaromativorans]MED5526483.1 ABC transporter permease [Pseudomonadota bacterium]